MLTQRHKPLTDLSNRDRTTITWQRYRGYVIYYLAPAKMYAVVVRGTLYSRGSSLLLKGYIDYWFQDMERNFPESLIY